MADEMEARIAALELLLIEVLADLEPGRLQTAIARIAGGGPGDDLDSAARAQAVAVLEDALTRHDVFASGFTLRRPGAPA